MIEGMFPFRCTRVGDLRSLFKPDTGMDMTGPGDGLLQWILKILQEALRYTDPMGKIGGDHQLRTGVKIILHHAGMEPYSAPVRLMRYNNTILLTKLRGDIDKRQVLFQGKIIPACMTVDQDGATLHAELKIVIKRCLKIFEIATVRLVLMGYQQQLLFFQGLEKLSLNGGIVRDPGIDAVISGFPDPVTKGGDICVLVPP